MPRMKVAGIPRPKGSMHCIGPRTVNCRKCGHNQVVIHNVQPDDPKGLGKAWRLLLERAGHTLRRTLGGTYTEGVLVDAWFVTARPKSAPDRKWPTTPPDVDKLSRMLLDALQESAVLANDSLVVDLCVHKRFVGDPDIPEPGMDQPGVLFLVDHMPDPAALI